jgi:hypothetical protein
MSGENVGELKARIVELEAELAAERKSHTEKIKEMWRREGVLKSRNAGLDERLKRCIRHAETLVRKPK